MSFLDQFSVLLLDMNGTFMVGHDRFGPDEDYFATYVRLGGRDLDRASVSRIVNVTMDTLLRAYQAPEQVDDFPSVAEALHRHGGGIQHADLSLLETVIAIHELGSVPTEHDQFLRDIAPTHSLGIVSNLWSLPDLWVASFRKSGLLTIFKALVFSSQGRSIKPSSLLFDKALAAFPPGSAILFVGDSLERDIMPAKKLGLSTAWIAPRGSAAQAADVIVECLPELKNVAVQ
ncbi:MAG: HAD family hydrolase [bacterium]|nr:HAD family hydrolase [bacterium]